MVNLSAQFQALGIPVEIEPIAGPGAEDPQSLSQEQMKVEAAKFLLSELLEQKRYAALVLTETQGDNLIWSVVSVPLPSGVRVVDAIRRRLKKHLTRFANKHKAPATPKLGRTRQSLHYDYKKPVAPSKAIEQTIPLHCLTPRQEFELQSRTDSECEESEKEPSDGLAHLRTAAAGFLKCQGDKTCARCGNSIEENAASWCVTLRITPGETTPFKLLEVSCENCGTHAAESQKDEWWTAELSIDELAAHRLRRQGLTQAEIGNQLVPPRSQSQVSRILKRVEQKEQMARVERLRRRGGA